MRKSIISITGLILFLTSAALLPAQQFGIAVQDQVNAPLINPAAMGVGNSRGLGYINQFTGNGFENDFDLLLSLGNIAYSYERDYDSNNHLVAAGVPLGQGVYAGASYKWIENTDNAGGLGLSLLYRPFKFLSFAVKGEDLTKSAYTELGFGFRPLMFNNDLMTRLTLSGDARWDSDGFTGVSLGAFMEPGDGVKIFGDYNFERDVLNIGVSLAFSFLEVGSTLDTTGDDSFSRGQFHTYTSFKKQRSFIESGIHKAVEYDLARVILDSPVPGYSSVIPQKGVRSLVDFIKDMERIKRDYTTEAVIFRNQEFRTSYANLLEIESVLKSVKESGKKIYFYYDSAANLPYALAASVADGLYLSPAGSIDLKGFAVSNFYLRDFLAEWGIRVHNFQSHAYKTAYNMFSEAGMTPEEREALEYLYGGLHDEMIRMIETGRGDKLVLSAQETVDEGPFIYAAKAKELGLVDDLIYEDQFDRMMHEQRLMVFPSSLSTGSMAYQWEETGRPIIAVIYATGGITMGEGVAGQSIGSETMAAAIRTARENPLVKGIILRVNSGGGSSLASDLIAREVALCRQGRNPKPVVVSMGGAAASGGYYISAPATKILASPGTITGSIGVITIMPEISGLLERFKVGTGAVTTSEGADTGSIFRPMKPEEEDDVREYIAENYDQFISLVGEYRQMPVQQVHESAQGRVWTGSQAKDRGLVDETGGLQDAYRLMRSLVHTKKEIRLVEMVPGRAPAFWEKTLMPLAARIKSQNEFPLPEDLEGLMDLYRNLSQFEEGEALYLMPYTDQELGTAP